MYAYCFSQISICMDIIGKLELSNILPVKDITLFPTRLVRMNVDFPLVMTDAQIK